MWNALIVIFSLFPQFIAIIATDTLLTKIKGSFDLFVKKNINDVDLAFVSYFIWILSIILCHRNILCYDTSEW